MTDNERAAQLAGWEPGQDYGPYPDYENSIDAQIADLDPLVEAKWRGPMNERVYAPLWKGGPWEWAISPDAEFDRSTALGLAPARVAARLKALLAALGAGNG